MALTGIKVKQLMAPYVFERDGYIYIYEENIPTAMSAVLKDNVSVYAMTKKDGVGRKFVVGNAKARVARPLFEAYVWETDRKDK